MAKVNNKTKGFNSIPRDLVYDNELSDRARFLYVYMACKPDGWEFFQETMAKELGYGKETLRKYLDELITAGWITEEEQQKGADGKFAALDYTIEIKKKRSGKKPIRENTDSEKNRIGKNRQKEINSSNTNESIPTKENKEIDRKVLSNESTKSTRKKELTEEEKEYQEKMREKFPRIMKMEQPLTLEEAKKLKGKYDSDMLKQIMHEMENWKPLLKKSVSAYMTIINWCNREIDRA